MRERTETLTPGTRLGPYEIVSLLGAGGMGDVYRALDPRLGREVALKVLPGRTDESGRFRRFQTEAKAAASLTHPHIVAVHDVGETDGTAYIVSELVPGGTLTALLNRGPLSARRVLDLAIPLADALSAAHANGIVHRDLKPDNVLLAADGSPKIADFGLAKYLAPVPSGEDTAGTTLEDERTREGTVFGTVGYMSPEQAEGKPLDFRSDQFSFGSVLYEMATGTKAFRRTSAVDTLAAILHEEPPPIGENDTRIPVPLRWTIERCLCKDPAGRYDSTADLFRELATIRAHLGDRNASIANVVSRRRPLSVMWLATAATALLVVGLLAGIALRRAPAPVTPSFQQLTFRRGNLLRARYTPDGGSIIYSAAWDGATAEIFTARLDGTESRPFGIKNADVLAASSKGDVAVLLKKNELRSSGFMGTLGMGTLAVVPLGGGAPRELLEDVVTADWSPDGTQLAVVRREKGEWQLEYPMGHVLYRRKDRFGHNMRVSRAGTHVAFTEPTATRSGQNLKIVDTRGNTTTLFQALDPNNIQGLLWRPGDRELLFCLNREGNSQGDVGDIVSVDLGGHARTLSRGAGLFRAHDELPDGRLLIDQFKDSADQIFGSSTRPERNIGWQIASFVDDLSQDGALVLFHDLSDTTYLRRTDGSPAVRLGAGRGGSLSPDGRSVLVQTESEHEISVMPTGPGHVQRISIGSLLLLGLPRFAPDGKSILFSAIAGDGRSRLYLTDDSGRTPRPVSGVIHDPPAWPVFSPDGKEVAVVEENGGLKIYPLDFGPPRLISGFDLDDAILEWTDDGKSLYVAPRANDVPSRIERFNLASGRKQPWKTLLPPNDVGVYNVANVVVTRDGNFWVYNAYRSSSDELWQVTGLPR